jgi:hypothetical protein
VLAEDLTLRLSAPHITPASPNFRLPSWPPPDDFPVVIDPDGSVTSRYGFSSWDLGRIARRPCTISFGDAGSRRGRTIDANNAQLMRQGVLWFMYGERRGIAPMTLKGYANCLKTVFATCSCVGISAAELSHYPRVVAGELAAAISPGNKKSTIQVLHELYQARERVGFTLLTPDQIGILAAIVPDAEVEQTPFIPPRIWMYQASRMRAFLEEFLAHRANVQAAFAEVIDAYRHNFGSLANARATHNPPRAPFNVHPIDGCIKLGSFAEFAARHGIADLLAHWCLEPDESWESLPKVRCSIKMLSEYFKRVGMVGTAYLQCFSGMRDAESMSLRSRCLRIETDPGIGKIHTLQGVTSKTKKDPDARWVTAPSAKIAVDAMAVVARLRTDVAIELAQIPLTPVDRDDPYLVQRGYEPWIQAGHAANLSGDTSVRPSSYSIARWQKLIPKLFDPEMLRVQPDDERIALLITPSLDLDIYGVGKVWPLAPHQYRRAVAVNMSASDVVSDPSLQSQLKHLVRAQSVYYGAGFAYLKFSQTFATELIATRYEMAARESGVLSDPNWVSPHGEARKAEILLRFHSEGSGDQIERNMRKGLTAIKQTLFGICTRRDYCPYGGHDNIVHCPTCTDALLDKRKRGALEVLGRTIAVRLVDAPPGTPLRAALEAEAAAVKEAVDVVS